MADAFFIQAHDPGTVDQARTNVLKYLSASAPEGLVDAIDGAGWSLVTVRNPFVPYAAAGDPQGAAVVIGSTYDPAGPRLSDLRSPSPSRRSQTLHELCLQLDYGLAVAVAGRELLVGADWLGMYPVYSYRDDSAFIVTSTPALLRCHAGFCPNVDVHGLVGILLLAHSCLGRTMFRGVSRLAAGHVLRYAFDGPASVEPVHLGGAPAAPRTIEEAVEAFDAVLRRGVGNAAREGVRSIYLSGGLDSRLAAGYLRRSGDGELSAVTLGDRRDLEVRAAARVASVLGTAHERVPLDLNDQPGFAKRTIDMDAMTSGLYSLMDWSFAAASHRPVLTGFLGDSTIGVGQVPWGLDPSLDRHTFPAMFASVNPWGLSPGVVREIVRAEGIDDVISEVWKGLRDEYDSYPGPPWQRSWWFDLLHRERFLVGIAPKVIAERSWPVLPYVRTDILRLVQASPLPLLADRRVQVEILLRRFPELARLPLARLVDRRFWTLEPRRPHFWTPHAERIRDSVSWHWRDKFETWEPRVFLRAFDFDGPGWKSLRDEARAAAGQADAWLDKDLVLRLIPPASTDARLRRAIVEATGRKALLGAVLCCRRHFA